MIEKKAATEFTVKRSEWNRGGQKLNAMLMNNDGKCCLGFYCLACGFTEEEIFGIGLPNRIPGATEVLPTLVIKESDVTCTCCNGMPGSTNECRAIAGTNDNSFILDSEREARLKTQFAAIGVTVNFVD